jgi:hypothetical protein
MEKLHLEIYFAFTFRTCLAAHVSSEYPLVLFYFFSPWWDVANIYIYIYIYIYIFGYMYIYIYIYIYL